MKTKYLCFDIMQLGVAIQGLISEGQKVIRLEYADGSPIEENIRVIKAELSFPTSQVMMLCEHQGWESTTTPPSVKAIAVVKETAGMVIE